PRFEPTPTTSQSLDRARWQSEATATGHARLGDSLGAAAAVEAATQADAPSLRRRVYERLEPAPGVSPAAMRFDEDATHQGFALPPGGSEDTSDDVLDPVSDAAALGGHPVGAALGDAPIDDDLGSAVAGEL